MSQSNRIPATPGSIPPSGWMLVREMTSNKEFWVDPKTLKPSEPKSILTDSQLKRIERLAALFAEPQNMTVEEWIDNMSRDSNPESEIRLWEHIAEVYEAELRSRPTADTQEKKLLHSVLLSASMLPGELCTPDNVVSMYPAAKSLPRLSQVIESYIGKP